MKVACIGAGYFSEFHLDGWNRLPDAELVALCDLDLEKAQRLGQQFKVDQIFSSIQDMIDKTKPDVIDIITPPSTHFSLVKQIAPQGINIICQKPLAPDYEEARRIVHVASECEIRLIVHENFRFQPWFRQIKQILEKGLIGRLFTLSFRLRTGDGWQPDAYMKRQPYFRDMKRFLVHEIGIHYIDVFRHLGGPITSVYASLRRLNVEIKGEDCGIIHFSFENGASGLWDANRYNMLNAENPRYTFGHAWVEGSKGTIRLYPDGKLTLQLLGLPENEIQYKPSHKSFAGDSVFEFQKHALQSLQENTVADSEGLAYLKNLEVLEAVYKSAREDLPQHLHNKGK